MRLALDHLTIGDAYPWEIVELAAQNDLEGCCLFLESMSVLPLLPTYSLIENDADRQRTKEALRSNGVRLDLVYPFTLTGRSKTSDYQRSLDVASQLSAQAVNILVYDRDPQRRVETVGAFVDEAAAHDLKVVVEFYPASAVSDLPTAAKLVADVSRSGFGINVDILHLYRSGGTVADLLSHQKMIHFAQLSDGPMHPPKDLAFEAASNRAEIGEGELPTVDFIRDIPSSVTLSVEVPDDRTVTSGKSQEIRAGHSIRLFKDAVIVAT